MNATLHDAVNNYGFKPSNPRKLKCHFCGDHIEDEEVSGLYFEHEEDRYKTVCHVCYLWMCDMCEQMPKKGSK